MAGGGNEKASGGGGDGKPKKKICCACPETKVRPGTTPPFRSENTQNREREREIVQ